jgi:hypothetical protein
MSGGEARLWRYGLSRICLLLALVTILLVLVGFGVLVYLMQRAEPRAAGMAFLIDLLIILTLAPIILFATTQLMAALRTRITLTDAVLKLVVPTWWGIYGLPPMRAYALRPEHIRGVDIRQEMRKGRKGRISTYRELSLRTEPHKRIMVCAASQKSGDLPADDIARAIARFSGHEVRECGLIFPRTEFIVRPWREFSSAPWPEDPA